MENNDTLELLRKIWWRMELLTEEVQRVKIQTGAQYTVLTAQLDDIEEALADIRDFGVGRGRDCAGCGKALDSEIKTVRIGDGYKCLSCVGKNK